MAGHFHRRRFARQPGSMAAGLPVGRACSLSRSASGGGHAVQADTDRPTEHGHLRGCGCGRFDNTGRRMDLPPPGGTGSRRLSLRPAAAAPRRGDHTAHGRLWKPDLPRDRRRPETGLGGGQDQPLLSERHGRRGVGGTGFRSCRCCGAGLLRPESACGRGLLPCFSSAPAQFGGHCLRQTVELLVIQQAQRPPKVARQGKARGARRAVSAGRWGPRIRRPPSFTPITPIPRHHPPCRPCDGSCPVCPLARKVFTVPEAGGRNAVPYEPPS